MVNNNAAALLLGLSAIAAGREVIVSRGEAIEIGGGFRVPDVLRQSGAKLVEVGTTNRTYVSDYEQAITENTGALLKAHASNFKVVGFTHSPTTEELVRLGRSRGAPTMHDVGSGCLLNTTDFGLAAEPRPQESVAAGCDLVFFSADKLLGGPQGGVIVGSQAMVERLARHPLARAMRDEATEKIPIWQMISADGESLRQRAAAWAKVAGAGASVVPTQSTIGGGSLPGETLPSFAVAIPCQNINGGATAAAARLREFRIPVIARVQQEQALLDPRAVLPDQDADVADAIQHAFGGNS